MWASTSDSISSWEWQHSLTKRKAVSCFYDYLMCFGNYPLFSAPHRYGGLSWSNAAAAEIEVGTCFQALRSELETHKAKLFLTARTDDVLAACFIMLQFLTAGGTGPDGGACSDPFNLSEVDGFAAPEKLQVKVGTGGLATLVRAWGRACPQLQTLPAEFIRFLLVSCADWAVHIKVGQILSLHISFASRTLLERRWIILKSCVSRAERGEVGRDGWHN